ncbi:radical SAM protein [Candidatus Woesearchaeota archaeon]|nr:radical SAM protein [Candidatus Woesearchaeota archaeon]
MNIDLKLGYDCNNNCIHCVIADKREIANKRIGTTNRTTEQCKAELFESRIAGCYTVILTGGEPTIRKDLLEIVECANGLGYIISMQTNGRMFFYPEFCELLSPYNIVYVIALHGPTAEIHDSITRASGSFEQTVQGIKNLKALHQNVIGKLVIQKNNIPCLEKTVDLFLELGIKTINMAFPHPLGNAKENFQFVVPRYSETRTTLLTLIDKVKKVNIGRDDENRIKIIFETLPFCVIEEADEYNHEKICQKTETYIKDLVSSTQKWNVERPKEKTKFPQCEQCAQKNDCEGVWKEYSEEYGGQEFQPLK